MRRSKYVAVFIIGVVVIGLLAAQYSLDNPTGSAVGFDTNSSETVPAAGDQDGSDAATPTVSDEEETAVAAPPNLGPAPALTDLEGWLQSDATSLDSFSGQVRIVQFWTYSCDDCAETIPHLQQIYANYQPQGLEIIGVHAPELETERDPNNVAAAALDLGVTWPIALDTEKANFQSWQEGRPFWPRTYVLDQNGEIRFDHIGVGNYDELTATVDYLITKGP